MAESYYPFDAGPGSTVTESEWRGMSRQFAGSGVTGLADAPLRVTAGTGRVNIAAGEAFVDGVFYKSTANVAVVTTSNGSAQPQRCTVVLRLDPTANTIAAAIVYGTPAASPTAPTLTQAATGVWELPLADFTLAAGTANPTTVTDRRNRVTPNGVSPWYTVPVVFGGSLDKPIQVRREGDTLRFTGHGAVTAPTTGQLLGTVPSDVLVGQTTDLYFPVVFWTISNGIAASAFLIIRNSDKKLLLYPSTSTKNCGIGFNGSTAVVL